MYKKAYGGEYFAFTFLALVIERGVNALTAYLGNLALGPSGQTAVEMPDPVPLHRKRRPRRLRTRARLDGSHPRCPLDHTCGPVETAAVRRTPSHRTLPLPCLWGGHAEHSARGDGPR